MSEEVTRRRYRRGGGDKDQGDYYSVVSTAEEGQLRQLDDDAAKENESCSGDDGLVVKISDAECSSESLPQPQDDFRAISDCDEDSFLVTAAIESASLSAAAGNRTYLEMTLFPDDQFVYRNIVFADGEFAIKLIKFTVFTFVGICFIFYLVRWMVRLLCFCFVIILPALDIFIFH